MITGSLHQTNKHFVLKLISFNSGQLQISELSGQLQNNSVDGVMSITINRVIIISNCSYEINDSNYFD